MNWKHFLRLAAHVQLMPVLESGEETLVGGQAVMEGVMMRAPHSYCVAVRRKDGSMATEESPLGRLSDQYPIFKLPILRGIGTLGQAMWLGVKALKFSANVAAADLEEEEAKAKGHAADANAPKKAEIPGWLMTVNLIFSFAFFIFLYKLVPLFLTRQLEQFWPSLKNQVLFSLVDGTIRLVIFLAFLWSLSRMKDIRRVFEFHGAEHKVVFNFESGQDLNVQNAQRFVTWHPRCGTSFLLVVMIVSIAVYAVVPVHGLPAQIALRVVALPVIAGLSYEMIRFAARRRASLLAAITAPGLWLQRITTQPPADDQVAVAIHALDGAMDLEKKQGGELVIA